VRRDDGAGEGPKRDREPSTVATDTAWRMLHAHYLPAESVALSAMIEALSQLRDTI